MGAKPGRRPADQSTNGRDAIWAVIRTQGDAVFTVASLVAACGANNKTCRDYLKGLTAAGYIEQASAPDELPTTWRLVRDIGHEAPRVRADGSNVTQGTVTEQLWRGMFMLKEFSFRDLMETASVDIPEDTAKSYCKMLLATGYLRVIVKAAPHAGRIARYRLIRNNGPKPPKIQRVKRVYDPNTGEVFTPEDML